MSDKLFNQKGPVQLIGTEKEWRKLGGNILSILGKDGLPRLMKTHKAIEDDAKLPMPPVRVIPYGWPLCLGVDFATCVPIYIENVQQFCAVFPVSTLIIIDNDILIRRILCHEFAHCFWIIQEAYKKTRGFAENKEISLSPENLPENITDKELAEKQYAIDSTELVNPENWFGKWDIDNFMPEDSPILNEFSMRYIESWINAGLPVQALARTWKVDHNLGIDNRILCHLQKLLH